MARRLRIWEKKRGARSTGSSAVGTAGEIAFFAGMLMVGIGAILWVLYSSVVPKWRSYHNYVEVQAEVVDTGVGKWQGPGVTTYRPEILIKYEVDGQAYQEWTYDTDVTYSGSETDAKEIIHDYAVGDTYRCFYDPNDPRTVRMSSGSKWSFWLLLFVPVSFIVIGGVGLGYTIYQWTVSAERRSATTNRLAVADGDAAADAAKHALPNVPSAGDLTNSPGTQLAYRLPTAMKPVWQVFWLSAFSVLWNVIAVGFVVLTVRGLLKGEASAALVIIAIGFLATGIATLYYLVKQTLATSGVGPTRIEISDHPLTAGGKYDLFLSQAGGREIQSLDVSLVCDEVTTYRQGTDTRTEIRRVYEQTVLASPSVNVAKGQNYEARSQLDVPTGIMHSFKADHNEIQWRLQVEGTVDRWRQYDRSFPVMIHPST
jgi:hypothetical protein